MQASFLKIKRPAILWILVAGGVVMVLFFLDKHVQPPKDWRDEFETIQKDHFERAAQKGKDDIVALKERGMNGTLNDWETSEWMRLIEKPKEEGGYGGIFSGTISQDKRSGWIKYTNDFHGIGISFPETWRAHEHPDGEKSSIVSLLNLWPGYGRGIEIYFTDNLMGMPAGYGVQYIWQKAVEKHGVPTPTSVNGEPALAFFDIETEYIDGGVPVFGQMILFPARHVLIVTSEHESEPNSELDISLEIYDQIVETVAFDE